MKDPTVPFINLSPCWESWASEILHRLHQYWQILRNSGRLKSFPLVLVFLEPQLWKLEYQYWHSPEIFQWGWNLVSSFCLESLAWSGLALFLSRPRGWLPRGSPSYLMSGQRGFGHLSLDHWFLGCSLWPLGFLDFALGHLGQDLLLSFWGFANVYCFLCLFHIWMSLILGGYDYDLFCVWLKWMVWEYLLFHLFLLGRDSALCFVFWF